MASVSSYIPSWVPPLQQQLQSGFNRRVPLGWTVLTTVGIATGLYVVSDIYDYFICTPMNARGMVANNPLMYSLSGFIRLYRRARGLDGTRTRAIHSFVKGSKNEMYKRRFLKTGDLEVRRGPRPEIVRNGVPQRQVPQVVDPELKAALESILATLATTHAPQISTSTSIVEVYGPALFLRPNLGLKHPDVSGQLFDTREFAHVHESDSSMHVCLAPLDAAEAIEKGWAVRFPLAGAGTPQGMVFVYAPRDRGEVEAVGKLVEASLAWMTAEP